MTLILFAIYAAADDGGYRFQYVESAGSGYWLSAKTIGAARGSVAPVVAVVGFAMCAAFSLLAFASFAIPAA